MSETFRFKGGDGPLVVAIPHVGTRIPPEIATRLTDPALKAVDADWHLDRLYDFLEHTDASVLMAVNSRTAIDLNRAPEDTPLYPGRFETGLCPRTTFDGEPLYLPGREPDADEVKRRLDKWWRPYHAQLKKALDDARSRHGFALLLDAHSIRAEVPNLFEGRLPTINVGCADGASCAPALRQRLEDVLDAQDRYTWVVDGRFKGGWTTRWYGRPAERVHAVQFELTQADYMDERTFEYLSERAAPLQDLLKALVGAIRTFRP